MSLQLFALLLMVPALWGLWLDHRETRDRRPRKDIDPTTGERTDAN